MDAVLAALLTELAIIVSLGADFIVGKILVFLLFRIRPWHPARELSAFSTAVAMLVGSCLALLAAMLVLQPGRVALALLLWPWVGGLALGVVWLYPRYVRKVQGLLLTPGEHQGMDAVETVLRVKAKSTSDSAWLFIMGSVALLTAYYLFSTENAPSTQFFWGPLSTFLMASAAAWGSLAYWLVRRTLALQVYPHGRSHEYGRRI